MRKLTYAIFSIALIVAFYCAYNQGVINERKRWQEIYFCEYDAKSDARLCMKNESAIIQFGKQQNVIPPSNIRAKVK